ncbi:isoprenylcysteine carboxylmethyltransferase family protein [Thiohalocapsa marina]|uniref:Isoprenylcysteine carboxylmethyltransferase family protein n=1 Tax=Thiohalocapsa marina TaxID=424902 RepID=A0A5M8FL18_9GAMM|nr:isoprenylcysteine carboxylmethyltransferase family protein [Thiohalocapsa marina]KAA6185184.1 isoprenylcysteine carboxylmethyltransferase family protein [Thiohalocapsa marina]
MTSKQNTRAGLGRRGEWLVALQFALMAIFFLLPVWQPGLGAAAMDATMLWRSLGAGLLGLVALVFGGLGSHHIRDYLTPLPYPVDHSQLVQHGVYGLVRHPLYASLLFAGLAWTLYHLSLSHLLFLAVCFLFFDYKASREEAWLTERHPEYVAYAQRVRKFLPWVY